MKTIIGVLGLSMALMGSALAEVAVNPDGSATWEAGVDGVSVEYKPDGKLRRVSARVERTVEFPDRRGILKAQKVAEMQAEAAFVQFMKKTVSSSDTFTEIETEMNKASQLRQKGAAPQVSKVDERVFTSDLRTVVQRSASGQLRGVVVLEKGYDEAKEMAWAVVGISEKSIDAALGLEEFTSREQPSQPEVTDTQTQGPVDDGIRRMPSEIRRIKQKDW
ncbi:hypothetical protein [Microvirga arabica]|uniref:hypothetical protein n=1 Tax=Microvirga arabica TaxID=1128671 RepID=UPI00193AC94F|nr:hypothetical protein [Microvirga arabica]MBM1169656.1 hypothetical protein [Microvirga arabica]